MNMLLGEHRAYARELIGGCEETTTGVHRLRALAREGRLPFPMLDVNDADSKHLFDNRHGTGQSVWDGIMYATNNMVAAARWWWQGLGSAAGELPSGPQGLGANVIVTEVDPHRALEAAMEGYRVMPMAEAAPLGDVFVTATGCKDVICKPHLERMKHNAILANAGHFDVEINKEDPAFDLGTVREPQALYRRVPAAGRPGIKSVADGRL